MAAKKRPVWLELLVMILVPVAGMALGIGTTILLNIDQTDYTNLVVNLFYLAACLGLLRFLKFSREDLGLKIIPGNIRQHVIIALIVFGLYMLYYIFAVRITGLKPFSSSILWGLLTYTVVVVTEELYFRGMLYGYIQNRFSGRTALIVTALLFGLLHARQGWGPMLSKTFTGFLWGSVRYATGMIFLLIFPIHFAYNTTWLLFDGNWLNPPAWGIIGVTVIEIGLGAAIVVFASKRARRNKIAG